MLATAEREASLYPPGGKPEANEFWFAVCCKPRQEVIAEVNLQRQDFHVYFPRLQSRIRRAGKWLDTVEALFPRYMFIKVDPELHSLAPVRSTRGVIGLLRFGGQVARVPEDIIAAIRQREDAATGLHPDDRPAFTEGMRIKLVEGPLAGMEGLFSQTESQDRVIVLLELLGKANKVAVHRDAIVRAA